MQPLRSQVAGESGQAMVESALALPLQIFLILGVLQLFLMLQSRILAQYAVFTAVRSGSVTHGDCEAMTHAAIAALLPSFTRAGSPAEIGQGFRNHRNNRYRNGHNGQIVELVRESPDPASVPLQENLLYDQPPQPLVRLEVRMLYWYRLRIPFADWVIGRMLLAHFGLREYHAANPTLLTREDANWVDGGGRFVSATRAWPGGAITDNLLLWADNGTYLFPIEVNSAMRMMTPPKKRFWRDGEWACPL